MRKLSVLTAAAVFCISAAPSFADGTIGGFTFAEGGTAVFEGGGGTTGPINFQVPATGEGVGWAYVTTTFDLTGNPDFSAFFEFSITIRDTFKLGSGADGLVFVIHNDTDALDAISSGGGTIGYYGVGAVNPVAPSVAVEFDTWGNSAGDGSGQIDPLPLGKPGNHVNIALNGVPTMGGDQVPAFELETLTGPLRFAWVDYDSATLTLDVYLSETNTKPNDPLISKVGVDIETELGNQAYIGFTSATGAAFSSHRVFDFDIEFGSDSDGDGVPDAEDACPDSDLSATVMIGACDSGAPNILFGDGCTISDLVSDALAMGGEDALEDLLEGLEDDGILSEDEAEAIEECAEDDDDDDDDD